MSVITIGRNRDDPGFDARYIMNSIPNGAHVWYDV